MEEQRGTTSPSLSNLSFLLPSLCRSSIRKEEEALDGVAHCHLAIQAAAAKKPRLNGELAGSPCPVGHRGAGIVQHPAMIRFTTPRRESDEDADTSLRGDLNTLVLQPCLELVPLLLPSSLDPFFIMKWS